MFDRIVNRVTSLEELRWLRNLGIVVLESGLSWLSKYFEVVRVGIARRSV